MDVVLGVALASDAPATIHTVLVCGEYGDGVTLEELSFDVPTYDSADFAAVDAVIAAILRARDAADTAGHHVVATGVTATDPLDAAALSARLSASGHGDLEKVVLISPVLAAASLARNLGETVGCDRMGLLSVESTTATLAVVDCVDGSITRIFRQPLDDGDATAAVDAVADRLNTPETCPDGLFLICSSGDPTALRPRLEATFDREVCEPAEPRAALARGAALASARLAATGLAFAAFEDATAALAYTQEPESGALAPAYYDIPALVSSFEADDLAYSAVPDDEAEAATEIFDPVGRPTRRPLLVAAASLASASFAAASALMVAMTLDITPNLVALRPDLGRALTIPHRSPNLQVPASEPFGGQPPVMGQAPVDSLPMPPLSVPSAPELPAPASGVPVAMPGLPAAMPGLPAPAPVPVAARPALTPVFVPAPVFGPPLPLRPPVAHDQTPFILAPIPQPAHRRPVASGLPDLSFLLGLPGKKPIPPSSAPKPPVEVPTPPVVKPDPPIVLPNPPVLNPKPPVVNPKPPVELPDLPVIKPQPPVIKPDPPVIKPNPPVIKPIPPVIKPNPPVQIPDAPIKLPEAPVVNPNPPIQLPNPPAAGPNPPFQLPNLPLQPPNTAPPVGMPALPAPQAPQAPTFPGLPAFQAPRAPVIPAAPAMPAAPAIPAAPSMPAFNPPALPSLPAPNAPSLPAFPAPQAPSMPAFPAPSAPSMPNLGGGRGGIFGGGKPGGGIFGGNPGGGIFGGGKPGGIFGGNPGGGLFGGGHGGGLFGGGHGGGGLFGGGGGGLFGH